MVGGQGRALQRAHRAWPCMGLSKSSADFAALPVSCFLHFFLRSFLRFNLTDGFLPSQPQFPHAVARRGGQDRPSLGPLNNLRRFQAASCTAPSKAADLGDWAKGYSGLVLFFSRADWTMSRGARCQSSSRCRNLVFGGSLIRTMMHVSASAAKLRGGGPILKDGMEAMAKRGTPPPRTVIGGRHYV